MTKSVPSHWWEVEKDEEEVEIAPVNIHIERGDGTKAEKIVKRFLNEYCAANFKNANWRNGFHRNAPGIDLTDKDGQYRDVQVKLCTKGHWNPGTTKNIETVLEKILRVSPNSVIALVDVDERSRILKRMCVAHTMDCFNNRFNLEGNLRSNLSLAWLVSSAGGHFIYDITGYESVSSPLIFSSYLHQSS